MERVVIIGSGNVATSLAHGLARRCDVVQIYSRQLAHAQALADAIGCVDATNDLNKLVPDADAYIIAVRDDAIADVVNATSDNGALWVHTSGSKPIDLFDGHRTRYGVLYPMQSFSRQVVTPLDDVHFFIEANNEDTLADVQSLGELLSCHVVVADSEQRRQLHIAAVFSCNFANHMWTLADELLSASGLSFEAMKPLIRTTVDKLEQLSPAQSQTGPAMRHDSQVIAAHMAMLDGDKRDIYDLLTKSIMNRNSQEENAQ
ncbi:MAG: DUF2520 domain-containing protein [Muribaculaceae bacterium]|nr:DUF2520 domain-containing protein [Muribaculaceae bacterium]